MAAAPAPSPAALHPQQLSGRPPKLHIDTSVSDAAPAETARPNSPASPSPPMAHAAAPPPSRNHSPQKAAMRSRVEHAEADDVIAHSGVRGVSGVLVGATLGEARTAELDALGFEWVSTRQCGSAFMHSFRELRAFYDVHGHTDVRRVVGDDAPLARWCAAQRKAYAKGQLPPKRSGYLDGIEFEW